MAKKILSILFFLFITINTVPCIEPFVDSTITTITSDDESSLIEAIHILNLNGGVIYIDTPVITITSFTEFNLNGTKSGGIIGKEQSNRAYPRIDFQKAVKAGYFSSGFTISGSQLYMKYLIIENAGLNGILISGSNNVLEHIITRYNSYSGIQISNYATSNKLSYCYSYRNINFISGSMYYGYGFYLQMPGPDNIFNYCFSWDNSNDGWINVIDDDSYDILHSASWNNGNPDVFTGKYDYDNRKSLDKNLWTIQHLIDSDPNFENNYKKRKFNIENGKILGKDAISWYNTFISESRGNGFNFVTRIPRKNKYINLDTHLVLIII